MKLFNQRSFILNDKILNKALSRKLNQTNQMTMHLFQAQFFGSGPICEHLFTNFVIKKIEKMFT
jgi:hypothetical protein